MKRIVYKDIDRLPVGTATTKLTRGCLVLEGGGWKGLYTLGVLDSMMEHDIELTSVVGVSAGALSAAAEPSPVRPRAAAPATVAAVPFRKSRLEMFFAILNLLQF